MAKAGAFLIAHGAGTGPDHSSLVALERAVAPLPSVRLAFPYRAAGRRAPDRAPVLVEAVRNEAAALCASAHIRPDRLVLGGRSMGGRMCSMAVADALPARALVLICYPLHPPGKPDSLRVAHLPSINVPCLFVSGTRDAFGTPDELEAATSTIAGPVTHVWCEKAGHDLRGLDDRIASIVAEWIRALR
jgi:predicted alpha/beta-hydrolase family hydrolase